MIALVIVVPNEGGDLCFKVTGQEVVLQQDAVLERLMPTLDLALGLHPADFGGVHRSPATRLLCIVRDLRNKRDHPVAC